MNNNFFKNFRESTDLIPTPNVFGVVDFPKEYNLPNTDAARNSYDWQYRVAVPFSYKIPNKKTRQYGIIYAPRSEAKKFHSDYDEYGKFPDYDKIAIYGAELANGPSLTAKGFIDLFKKNKENDFRLEDDITSFARERSLQSTPDKTVPVNTYPIFKKLREALQTFQDKGGIFPKGWE